MSSRIATATGVSSNIDVPSDFRDLFERLSFSTMQDNFLVPLRNRGDGLQARHIPHILEFISDQNKKYNIWGYEEPENSLEMVKSFEVAEQFANDFSQNNQIFATSHSPAFYGLSNDGVSKYYFSKTPHNDESLVSSVVRFSDVQSADQNLGIAHIIADRSKVLFDEIQHLKQNLHELKTFANPVLLTEGKHDKIILENAIAVTGRSVDGYRVMCCEWMDGEGGGAPKLKQTLENIPAAETNFRVGIFDRDSEGIGAFSSLKKFKLVDGEKDMKVSPSGRVFAILLPENDWDDPYFELAGRPTAIEQMFPRSVVGDDIVTYRFDVAGGSVKKKDVDKLIASQDFDTVRKLVKVKIEISDKTLASKRICNAPRSSYDVLSGMLERMDKYIFS